MRTLAFDGRMGASGDMLLAALVAAGADPTVLTPVEDALGLSYRIGETTRNGIAATTVNVVRADVPGADGDDEADANDDPDHSHSHDYDDNTHNHGHSHDDNTHNHGHSHDDNTHNHGHSHDDHEPTPVEGSGPHRSVGEVLDILSGLNLDSDVETRARSIFRRLAEAEATVHGSTVDDIHFHEVGADDAIADVVGCCLLLSALDVDRVVTTPLAGGGGSVQMSHGTYPVPAPAVVELAADADWSLVGGPVESELLTPTGAAILAEFADGVDSLPSLRVRASGYGAGSKSVPDYPNVLRAIVGTGERLRRDDITVLETNLDDAAPELLGGLQESLAEVGAHDVSILPVTMKKSRPGHLVKVITKPEDAERVAHRLAVETGTLGIREHGAGHRWVADRRFETVTLDVDGEPYDVSVKIASTADGAVYDVSAEYDDAAAVARATGLPVREVLQRAERAVEHDD